MACLHGSEKKFGAPSITWISYRDLLGCNGQGDEPWYCNLIIDIPNLLTLKNTNDFCSLPQPIDPGYPGYADVIAGHALDKLALKAENLAWGELCTCKPEPPPTDNPPPPTGFKDFPVKIPLRPECQGVVQLAFYKDYSFDNYNPGDVVRPILGIPSAVFNETRSPSGELILSYKTDIFSNPLNSGIYNTSTHDYIETFYPEIAHNDPDTAEWGYSVTTATVYYTGASLTQKLLRLADSPDLPAHIIGNYLLACPEPPPPPPPPRPDDIPPPPNGCCPVPPVDFSPLINRIDELQSIIDNLQPNPVIGQSTLETPEKPFGVYIRERPN